MGYRNHFLDNFICILWMVSVRNSFQVSSIVCDKTGANQVVKLSKKTKQSGGKWSSDGQGSGSESEKNHSKKKQSGGWGFKPPNQSGGWGPK